MNCSEWKWRGSHGSWEHGSREVGPAASCEIVAGAVYGDPSYAPFTLPEVVSRVWPVGSRAMARPSAVGQRQVHREQRFVESCLEGFRATPRAQRWAC